MTLTTDEWILNEWILTMMNQCEKRGPDCEGYAVEVLDAAVASTDPKSRKAFETFVLQGECVEKTAQALGMSVVDVRKHIAEFIRQVAKALPPTVIEHEPGGSLSGYCEGRN